MSAPAPEPSPAADMASEPTTLELMEFFCHECQSSVSLPMSVVHPLCPLCHSNFLEPAPEVVSTLGTIYLFIYEDYSEDPVDTNDIEIVNPIQARLYIARFIQEELEDIATPASIASFIAVAISVLDYHIHNRVLPAPVASIAALPTVEVSDPDAECAICLENLPLTSVALMLPCSHFFHSGCIVSWLQIHNSCPMCRSYLPDPVANRLRSTLTFRLITNTNHRTHINSGAMFAEAPVLSSPTQLTQARIGVGGGGPANSGDTLSTEQTSQLDSNTIISEARDGDGDDFSD